MHDVAQDRNRNPSNRSVMWSRIYKADDVGCTRPNDGLMRRTVVLYTFERTITESRERRQKRQIVSNTTRGRRIEMYDRGVELYQTLVYMVQVIMFNGNRRGSVRGR